MTHTAQDYQQDDLQDAVRAWIEASIKVQTLARPVLGRPGEWGEDFVRQLDVLTRAITIGRYDAQVFCEMSADDALDLMAKIEAEVLSVAHEVIPPPGQLVGVGLSVPLSPEEGARLTQHLREAGKVAAETSPSAAETSPSAKEAAP